MAGHVAFVANYEMHAAPLLHARRGRLAEQSSTAAEACGTSGQKAAMTVF